MCFLVEVILLLFYIGFHLFGEKLEACIFFVLSLFIGKKSTGLTFSESFIRKHYGK